MFDPIPAYPGDPIEGRIATLQTLGGSLALKVGYVASSIAAVVAA